MVGWTGEPSSLCLKFPCPSTLGGIWRTPPWEDSKNKPHNTQFMLIPAAVSSSFSPLTWVSWVCLDDLILERRRRKVGDPGNYLLPYEIMDPALIWGWVEGLGFRPCLTTLSSCVIWGWAPLPFWDPVSLTVKWVFYFLCWGEGNIQEHLKKGNLENYKVSCTHKAVLVLELLSSNICLL